MPSITNVGGSLTSAIALTLLAWAVRLFRAAAQQRKQGLLPDSAKQAQKLGRFFCTLTPAALRMLVLSPSPVTVHTCFVCGFIQPRMRVIILQL